MSDILVPITPGVRERAPTPWVYHDLVLESGVDPEESWYPCGCYGRLRNEHEDDCWLSWIAYPPWATEETTEVPVVLDVPYTEAEKRVADSGVATSVPDTSGWCAPAETLNWCGHALSAGCGCEFTPVLVEEVVMHLPKREESEVDDDTALLGVVEPLDEDETSDVDEERSDDGDVQRAHGEDTVDGGDGRS